MPAPKRNSIRPPRGIAFASFAAILLVCTLPTTAVGTGSIARPEPRILSASWGTDNAVGCPNGAQGLDNIPVTFDWFIRRSSIQTTDFRVVRSDGSVATPTCALQFPPDESDEAQTVNLIGDFGDSVSGPTPVAIRVVGALQGRAPGAIRWRQIPPLPKADVEPLSGGPYIVDAWTLTPAIYRGDANRCSVGKTFVRVMWSNGLTAYPTGAEVGAARHRFLPRHLRAAQRQDPRGCPARCRRPPRPPERGQRRQHARPLPAATPSWSKADGSDDRRRTDSRPQRRSEPRAEVQSATTWVKQTGQPGLEPGIAGFGDRCLSQLGHCPRGSRIVTSGCPSRLGSAGGGI